MVRSALLLVSIVLSVSAASGQTVPLDGQTSAPTQPSAATAQDTAAAETMDVVDLIRRLRHQEQPGVWIGEYAKQITVVTPGGVADRAGLRVGDILEFDPGRAADWVLAGYRHMPERFIASVTVRRADGSRDLITLSPERVAYLPPSTTAWLYWPAWSALAS